MSACLSVLTHSREDDVQSDVIFALGLHWQSARLYPEIMRMLADRAATSSVVVGSAIASLSALARSDAAKVPEALSMLAQVTADKAMSAAIRATAYSNAFELAKKITSREFAGLADNDIASMESGLAVGELAGTEHVKASVLLWRHNGVRLLFCGRFDLSCWTFLGIDSPSSREAPNERGRAAARSPPQWCARSNRRESPLPSPFPLLY